jgi:hypothetical protein
MGKLYLVLVILVILASGCVQNQSDEPEQESSTVSVDDLVQNGSFNYDRNSSKMLENTGGSVRAPVEFEFMGSDQDETYALNLGLFLKIFSEEGDKIKSKVVATEKRYEIPLGLHEVSLSENTSFTSCFATKSFHENNTWSLEDRNNSEVYCSEERLRSLNVDLKIEPNPVTLPYEDAFDVSEEAGAVNVIRTEKQINVTNAGEVTVMASPTVEGIEGEKLSNSHIQLSDNRGIFDIGQPGDAEYEKRINPGETVQMPVSYGGGALRDNEDRPDMDLEPKILVNAITAGDSNTAVEAFPFEVEIR